MGRVNGLPSPNKRLLTWKTPRKYREVTQSDVQCNRTTFVTVLGINHEGGKGRDGEDLEINGITKENKFFA